MGIRVLFTQTLSNGPTKIEIKEQPQSYLELRNLKAMPLGTLYQRQSHVFKNNHLMRWSSLVLPKLPQSKRKPQMPLELRNLFCVNHIFG